MPKKRFTPEEINGKLRHADVLLGQGKKVAEIVKVLGITEVTDFRWRQEFGGMSSRFLRRLRALTARKQGLRRPRHSSQRRCAEESPECRRRLSRRSWQPLWSIPSTP